MQKITYNLLSNLRSIKHNRKVEIDLYSYAMELYSELDRIGMIEHIKNTPQLGVIKVPKKLGKTRYDYIMLQLYLHKMIKRKLQNYMRLTYNNRVKSEEFYDCHIQFARDDKPTIGDIIQLLIIVYNIGHFYNTFTASRAITLAASKNDLFADYIINLSANERFKSVASTILDRQNYHRFHLLNSLLALKMCDQSKKSVSLSTELLYTYLNEEKLSPESKLKYVFDIFKKIRNVAYLAYDLQISGTPLIIDPCDDKAMISFLKELISEYNNNQSTDYLIRSTTKLLDDTFYNESSDVICYYNISKKMSSLLLKNNYYSNISYYDDLFVNKESIVNRTYPQRKDYVQEQMLKLTFEKENIGLANILLSNLERMHNVRVGYYDRYTGEKTIIVSIRNNCNSDSRIAASLKILRCSINSLRKIPNIEPTDSRFLLCAKFFLFFLFNENPVVIKPTINQTKCVICTRGKNNRKVELENLILNSNGNKDENHEAEFLLNILENDAINDTTITVPASIIVYKKDSGQKFCEFDGIIINPMRNKQQVIFSEAKNTAYKPEYAKNCIKEKLDKIGLKYSDNEMEVTKHDVVFKYTIKNSKIN